MSNQIDITPDVDLLENLRHSGISNMAALGEFLDNSIDAGARRISVHIYKYESKYRNIMMVDNGRGISEANIKDALTLAKSMKVGMDQLGRFGMGMKTAALSLTTNFEIITKTASGPIFFANFNVNKMKQADRYFADLRIASDEEASFFNNKLNNSSSGTILLLKYCDQINARTNAEMKEESVKYIGRVYRRQIENGVIFEVCDDHSSEIVPVIDPLMRNDARTIILADREIHQISIMNNGIIRNSNIEISASLLPETNSANKYELKINQTNQGIYLLRQNREIAQALAYTNVWGQKHNSKNRVRIELSVKPELDMEFRIDFNKGKGNPTTELKDQLSNILKPILERYNPYLKPTKGGTTPPTIEPPKPKPPTDIPPLQIEKPLPSDENGGQDPKAVVQIPPVIVSPPEIEEVLVEIPTGSIDTEGSKYKILENIAVFDEKDGYTLELNVISWHGKPAEFDLRYWNHTAGISREGISLSLSEIKNLKTVFKHIKFE